MHSALPEVDDRSTGAADGGTHPTALAPHRWVPAGGALVAFAVLLVGVVVAITDSGGSSRAAIVAGALIVSLATAVVAAVVDVRRGELPDRLTILIAATVVAAAIATGGWWQVALGAALAATPILAIHLVSPAAMGFGDVKFALALGAAVGLLDGRAALVAVAVGAAVAATVGLIGARRSVPLGPGLVIGTMIASAGAAIGRFPWQ